MQFLKTLFWVALAVVLVLFASVNWVNVTVRLWGGLEADIKLPILVLVSFLVGFLPMLILHRARLWSMKRRLEGFERQAAVTHAPVAPAASQPPPAAEPVSAAAAAPAPPPSDERIATDNKVWPAS